MLDRLKSAFLSLAKAARPDADYCAFYRARVLSQDGSTVDVRPEDRRLPDMGKVPLRTGVPGVATTAKPGTYVLIGFENGRPDGAFAMIWDWGAGVGSTNSVGVSSTTVAADAVLIGGASATEAVIKGTTYRQAQSTLNNAIKTALTGAATLPQLAAAAAAIVVAIEAFEATSGTFLSTKVKTQ
jgi:hypothetical protein